VQVSVRDGGANTCTEDMDFMLTGFSVSGMVAMAGNCAVGNGKPSDAASVLVSIFPVGSPHALSTVHAALNGSFEFGGISPGQYVVSARHSTWQMADTIVPVEVVWGPATVPAGLAVLGFEVSGVVSGTRGTPVQVFLYASGVGTVVGCESGYGVAGHTPPTGSHVPDIPPRCVVTTDAQGAFSFPGVACGTHTLIPKHEVRAVGGCASAIRLITVWSVTPL
jgi:hypothetical protein